MVTRKRPTKRAKKQFSDAVVAALDKSNYLRIRAGNEHRFIGIWVVVVDRRVFVRSWYMKPDGWYHAFLRNSRGAILLGDREMPVRAARPRGKRLKDAVDRAYAAKYRTRASIKYVKRFARGKRKETTTELTPL